MEFLPDAENNARNIAFLNKTKNQAKKLFKLAKQNQLSIEINNLSHAQEILAQINGFPDWHALEKTINNVVLDNHYNNISIANSTDTLEKSNVLIKNLETYKGIPVLIENEEARSLISIDYVSSDYVSFTKFINDIIKATSFQFNMEFHTIRICIEQIQKEQDQENVKNIQYFPINNHQHLGLNIEDLQGFLNVSYVLNQANNSHYTISAKIMVSTDLNMIEEHVTFCQIFINEKFKEFFSFQKSISYENDNSCADLDKFYTTSQRILTTPSVRNKDNTYKNEPSRKPNFLLNNFLVENIYSEKKMHKFNHTKWIFALYLLSQRQHQWKLNINLLDLSSKEINYFNLSHSENEDDTTYYVNDKYLKGLFKSLTSENFNYYESVDDSQQKIFPYKNNLAKTLPWNTGIPLINREDNVVDYYQPASSLQTSHITAIFAKPGSGKSMLMNMLNIGLCFAPGIQKLPRIGIVDIGPSSAGLISLLKNTLPIEKRHLAQYHRLKMTQEYCVNIFDTQLGCRFPTNEHRNFLKNVLQLLFVNLYTLHGESSQAMTGLIQSVIDDMYYQTSDKGHPKKYDKGINLTVDMAIKKIDFDFDFKTTWWEVVDVLFENNMIVEATIAQRYAVPLFSDACVSSQNDKIRDIYGSVKLESNQTVIQHFNHTIIEAVNQYRILNQPTVFDISEARIVSLDLDEVAKSGGHNANTQTAIMYMLARYILSKNFYLSTDTVDEMPYPALVDIPNKIPVKKYKSYHKQRINEYREDYKHLCFDEFHRVSNFIAIHEQVITDMREGRKWNVGITLASQSLNSFDGNMTPFFTNVFIMDGGNTKDCSQIANSFNLSSYEKDFLLEGKVHGPRGGKPGTMLAKFVTNNGPYSKMLSLPLNTTFMWCLSTTSEDIFIREKLTSMLGYFTAIKLLSTHYPLGIKKIVEMRKEEFLKVNKDIELSVIVDEIITSLINKPSI